MSERPARKMAMVMGGEVMGAIIGYVTLLAVGRYYGDDAFGSLSFAISATGIVMILGRLGLPQAHIRTIARGGDLSTAVGTYLRLRLGLLAIVLALLTVAAWIWIKVLGRGITDATEPLVLVAVLAVAVLNQLRLAAAETWIGMGRQHRPQIMSIADTATVALLTALSGAAHADARGRWVPLSPVAEAWGRLWHIDGTFDAAHLALLLAAAFVTGKVVVLCIAAAWWIKDRTPIGRYDAELAKAYLSLALPLSLMVALTIMLQHTDIILLGWFMDKAVVGQYAMSLRLANLALIGGAAAWTVLIPHFSAWAERDPGRLRRDFFAAERYLLLLLLPVTMAFVALAPEIIHIAVGDSFLGGATALRILGVWALVMVLNVPLRAMQLGAGHADVLLRIALAHVSANLVLDLLLIPESFMGIRTAGLGAAGAAWASVGSTLVAYSVNRQAAAKRLELPLVDSVQARMLVTGAALALGWHAAATAWPGSFERIWGLAAWGILGTAAYLVVMRLLGLFHATDIRFLWRTIDPRGLWAELRGRP